MDPPLLTTPPYTSHPGLVSVTETLQSFRSSGVKVSMDVKRSLALRAKRCVFFAWCGAAVGWEMHWKQSSVCIGETGTYNLLHVLHHKPVAWEESHETKQNYSGLSAALPYRCVPRCPARPVT